MTIINNLLNILWYKLYFNIQAAEFVNYKPNLNKIKIII